MKTNRISFGPARHETYTRYLADNCTGVEAVIYCHGGAFRYGRCEDNAEFLETLAYKTSMPVYSVGFRSIDDARMLDAMVGDITSAVNAIVRETGCPVVHMVGDSSGAYLALVTMLKALNSGRFETQANFTVKSAALICGYLNFRGNDYITNFLTQYPAFQYLPKELRRVLETDYSGLDLPDLLLITGDTDGCREDMVSIYDRITATKPSAYTKLIVVDSTEGETADHCFPIYKVNTDIGDKALDEMASLFKSHTVRLLPLDEVNDDQLAQYNMFTSVEFRMQVKQFMEHSKTWGMREYLKTKHEDVWCLTDSDKIIGILGLRVLSPDTAGLYTFRLEQKYRSGCLEELMISKAITRSREAGFSKLVVDLNNRDIESLKVFTSAGFKYAGKKVYVPFAGDMMELELRNMNYNPWDRSEKKPPEATFTADLEKDGFLTLPEGCLTDEMAGKGGEFVLTNSMCEGMLCLYTAEEFKGIKTRLNYLNSLDPVARKLKIRVIYSADAITIDSIRRIKIKPELLKTLGIDPEQASSIVSLPVQVLRFENRIEIELAE